MVTCAKIGNLSKWKNRLSVCFAFKFVALLPHPKQWHCFVPMFVNAVEILPYRQTAGADYHGHLTMQRINTFQNYLLEPSGDFFLFFYLLLFIFN